MLILAFDTSMAALDVCVWHDGESLARRRQELTRGHAERLVPEIEAAMNEAGVRYADLDIVAAGRGPGSFTGIRTALATARGMELATGVRGVGIGTLDTLLAELGESQRYAGRPRAAVVDTRRRDLYVRVIRSDGTSLDGGSVEGRIATESDLATELPPETVLAGDAQERVVAASSIRLVTSGVRTPSAAVMATLAASEARTGAALPLRPVYLRPPEATLPRDGGRVRPRDRDASR